MYVISYLPFIYGAEPIQEMSSSRRSVRFNDHTEVRCMPDHTAEDASLARLSYHEFMRKQTERARLKKKFPVPIVCKLALLFCVLVCTSISPKDW